MLALLTGLKQICNHPAQFLKQSGAVRLTGRSEKLELLDELLGTVVAEDGAVLVFTQYVAMARLIEQHLDEAACPTSSSTAAPRSREREAMVARFQAGEVPVFLLVLKAGGTGLNLTRADHVVHVDRWWNPAVEEQATDRAYRIGQTKPVQVHRMVTRGTLEERIAELLERKRALADAVLAAAKPPSPSSATRSCATWSPCARKRAARPTSPISSRRGELTVQPGRPGSPTAGGRAAHRHPSWWGKAWQRAVEEAAYVEADLRGGRTLARARRGRRHQRRGGIAARRRTRGR